MQHNPAFGCRLAEPAFGRLARLACALVFTAAQAGAPTGASALPTLARAALHEQALNVEMTVCSATPNDGATVFSTANASAIQQAVDAASTGGTVKVGGYCAGVQARAGTSQTVYLSATLTLAGGFTNTVGGWATSNPVSNPTVLDAQTAGRVIFATAPVTVSNLTAQNGNSNNDGGGAYFGNSVALVGSRIRSSTAGSGGGVFAAGAASVIGSALQDNSSGFGGGLVAAGTLAISATHFLNNSATGGAGGAFAAGPVTVTGTIFEGNATTLIAAGGGLYANSTLAIRDSQFLSNSVLYASNGGGGAYANGAASVTDSVFQGNRVIANYEGPNGGGLLANGTLAISGTRFIANFADLNGGGIYARGDTIVTGSTFDGNTASLGGGLFADSTLVISSSHFLGNIAYQSGGGLLLNTSPSLSRIVNSVFARNSATPAGGDAMHLLAAGGSVEIVHTTIANPTVSARAAMAVAGGTVLVTNTLVASHTIGIRRAAGVVNENFNLFAGVTTPHSGTVANGGTSITGTAGFVGPDADDYRIGAGSSAIDAGANLGVTVDRAGAIRPTGEGFEIGAYETRWRRAYLPSARRGAISAW